MGLRQLGLRSAYSSDEDDVLQDFYIPALEQAVNYDRLTGFFSSTSLAVAAQGIVGLLRNGGSIRLAAAPRLSKADIEAGMVLSDPTGTRVQASLLNELEPKRLEEEFVRDHVYALGWLIANNRLEIRLVIPLDISGRPMGETELAQSGIFHQKVGVLRDRDGSLITFSGSVNETAAGWLENIEEFKVFRSWEPGDASWLKADLDKFDRFWYGLSPRMKVVSIPQAVRERLISFADHHSESELVRKHYARGSERRNKVHLYDYQKQAVKSWVLNGNRGLFEMATGTGKTYTALGCIDNVVRKFGPVVVVVAAPYGHLVRQWKRETEKYGLAPDQVIIADGSNPGWKRELGDGVADTVLGYRRLLLVLTTHDTFCGTSFRSIMEQNAQGATFMLVADEVHAVGAPVTRSGLSDVYALRLGLSATPERWFDDSGTKAIAAYFGGVVFEFSLKRAITETNPATNQTYLTPFRYKPEFTYLTAEEIRQYSILNKKIGYRLGVSGGDVDDPGFQMLLFRRAEVVKKAAGKLAVLEAILETLPSPEHTLIYCMPDQIDAVMALLSRKLVIAHRFTEAEGTSPQTEYGGVSEREAILQRFAEGQIQVLVAIKCLDEGVDVPPARNAIFMASSGNPREHIQRMGRVLRRYPGKNHAVIYDIVVVPNPAITPPEIRALEWSIFTREMSRYQEIAQLASNNVEALDRLSKIQDHILGVDS